MRMQPIQLRLVVVFLPADVRVKNACAVMVFLLVEVKEFSEDESNEQAKDRIGRHTTPHEPY
jgi:hypothetical protein